MYFYFLFLSLNVAYYESILVSMAKIRDFSGQSLNQRVKNFFEWGWGEFFLAGMALAFT